MKNIRIAFVAPVDPTEIRSHFSGSTFRLFKALSNYTEISLAIVPENSKKQIENKVIKQIKKILGMKKYQEHLSPQYLGNLSHKASNLTDPLKVDFALTIGQGYLCDWKSKFPCAFFSDTLYGSKLKTHGYWKSLSSRQIKELKLLSKMSINNSKYLFISSDYAIQEAERNLQISIPVDKRCITLIGANIENKDLPIQFDFMDKMSKLNPLRILWMGKNWDSKGGEVVLTIFRKIKMLGIEVECHIVGVAPTVSEDGIYIHGFLNKDRELEYNKLLALYRNCHVFILPTTSDMTPCVLAEAAAFGLFIITTNVGGIPEMLQGSGALVIPLAGFVENTVTVLKEAVLQKDLTQHSLAIRKRYETHLNWDVIAQKIVAKFME